MKTQPGDLDIIKARQRAWAIRKGLTLLRDGYHCTRVHDNIFQGLSPGARRDFESGDGAELGKGGERRKIQALHSASQAHAGVSAQWSALVAMLPLVRSARIASRSPSTRTCGFRSAHRLSYVWRERQGKRFWRFTKGRSYSAG